MCVRGAAWTHELLTPLRKETEQWLGVPQPEPRCGGFQDPRGPVWALSPLPPRQEACPPGRPPALQQRPEPLPTSPIAEAVPHGHSLRTPIAAAPARADRAVTIHGDLGEAGQGPSFPEISWHLGALASGLSSDSPSVSLQCALDLLHN